MSEVFVSYKRENLAAVGRLVEALRAEGIGVWWDQDIPPNAAWEATIEQALAAAKLVIVAWSPASVASENVKAEARRGRQQGRLLQVFVEACEPPLFFGERQGVDLKHWSGGASDAAFRSVLEAVRSGLTPSSVNSGRQAPSTDDTGVAAPQPRTANKPSIAVLPFIDMTGSRGDDYFADGMAEEIATALSRFPSLFVNASGSNDAYRDSARNLKLIGQELGVRYLLEGSVRKAGGAVRISVKLIEAADGEQLWAERFDGTMEDVFALQDTVANAAAGQIEPNIEAAEIRRAQARPTEDPGAYELWLRGLHLLRTYGKEPLLEACVLLDKAIARDPDYALALGSASFCHSLLGAGADHGQADRRLGWRADLGRPVRGHAGRHLRAARPGRAERRQRHRARGAYGGDPAHGAPPHGEPRQLRPLSARLGRLPELHPGKGVGVPGPPGARHRARSRLRPGDGARGPDLHVRFRLRLVGRPPRLPPSWGGAGKPSDRGRGRRRRRARGRGQYDPGAGAKPR